MSPEGASGQQTVTGRPSEPGRVILVGCVAGKLDRPAPAADLYVSALFVKRRAYAEAAGVPWFIVSALHGLLAPDRMVQPYDSTIADLPAVMQRPRSWAERMWASRVACGLRHELGFERGMNVHGLTIELHAGRGYVDLLLRELTSPTFGWQLDLPVRGLQIGEQLAWYNARAGTDSDRGCPRAARAA